MTTALPSGVKPFTGFPLRENCDPANPFEAFLWMLVGIPGMRGAPLPFPVEYLQLVSNRLWECGARPVEEPVIKYQPPSGTDPNWITSPGSWVGVDAPDTDTRRPAEKVVEKLITQQQAELLDVLLAKLTPAQRVQRLQQAHRDHVEQLEGDDSA